VARARAAGVTILSVTDHDTVAGCDEAAAACREADVEFVPGIEITAVADGGDVHVLGYFVDRQSDELQSFLAEQRRRRIDRVRQMIERLNELGVPLDAGPILQPALEEQGRALGRPAIAHALVKAGVVADTREALDTWLARGRPAFVAREGPTPAEVIARIHDAAGIASLAHPGLLARDPSIALFAEAGLDALEAFHSEHDDATCARYIGLAARFGLGVSGGSDYHGTSSHGAARPGSVSLPVEYFESLRLRRRAASRATASGLRTSS